MDLQAYINELRADADEFCRSGATEFGRAPEVPDESLQLIETLGQAIRLNAQGTYTAHDDTLLKYYRTHLQMAEFVWRLRENQPIPRRFSPVDLPDKLEATLAAYPIGASFPLDDIDSRFGRDFMDGFAGRCGEPGPLRDRARRTAEGMIQTAKIIWNRDAVALYKKLGYRLPAAMKGFQGLKVNPGKTRPVIPPHHEYFIAAHEALAQRWDGGDEENFLIITGHLFVGLLAEDVIAFDPSWLDLENSQIILFPETQDELAVDAPSWFCSRVAANGGVIASGNPSQRSRKCCDATQKVREVFDEVEATKKIPCAGKLRPLVHLVTFFEWKVASTLLPVPAMSRLRHQTITRTERFRAQGKLIGELLAYWERQYPPALKLLPSSP